MEFTKIAFFLYYNIASTKIGEETKQMEQISEAADKKYDKRFGATYAKIEEKIASNTNT